LNKRGVFKLKRYYLNMSKSVLILLIAMTILASGCVQEQRTKVCEGSGVVVNITDQCPEYWCGDGTCLLGEYRGYSEDCSTCPQDCGACPPDKLSNFEVTSFTCDSILPELSITIKNTYYEPLTVREVQIWSTGQMPRSMIQTPNYVLGSGESKTHVFPMTCHSGETFRIEVIYIDSEGSHRDVGTNYQAK
jgi:hypothetical protein